MEFDVFSWVVIPLLIFSARIIDVSLGTLRIIFLGKGYKKLAPLIGFVEVLIWLLAVREVLFNLRNVACIVAYCAGFAIGNYLGLWLEEKLSIGMVLLRIVFKMDFTEFSEYMRKCKFGFTVVKGEGSRDKVKVLFSVMKRKDLPGILSKLAEMNPLAFYSIENIKSVNGGAFPPVGNSAFKVLFRKNRKSK
jgi:uncharacterized protein YebE (UPF0316 family)